MLLVIILAIKLLARINIFNIVDPFLWGRGDVGYISVTSSLLFQDVLRTESIRILQSVRYHVCLLKYAKSEKFNDSNLNN